MKPQGQVLTREMLREGGIQRIIKAVAPGVRILSEAERAASIQQILARRPDAGAGVWIFAYGSLIWNPAIHITTKRFARIHGWHRAFCLETQAGRGSPETPGLVLGLDRGGCCAGAALHVAERAIAEELPILWSREMVTGSYRPRWVRVRDETGAPFAHAIAFTIRRDAPNYAKLGEDELIHRLATAEGALGSNAEYLLQTVEGLQSLGIQDQRLEHLAERVQATAAKGPVRRPDAS